MNLLFGIVQSIMAMGASAILPIIITILGLVFRMKLGNAFKSGLTVGVGFIGLSLVVRLLNESIQPAVDYYFKLGSGYTIIDIGWPAVGAASWMAPFAALAIPLGLVINLVFVRFKLTKTMNVDIWNYMHFLIPGAMTYFLFKSFFLGLAVTLLMSIFALFLGDLLAKKWQDYFGLEGTTCTTVIYSGWGWPVAWATNKIIDFIPGLNKINLNIHNVNKKLGIIGDPIIIGAGVGVILGLLTKQTYQTVITMGMGIAGVMVLMPKVVGVLMDGLSPIGKSAKTFMISKMDEGSDLNIGMDIALGLGDPCTITTTILTIPLVILFALILPGVRFFPVGLLMSVCYISVLCAMESKGNLFRSVISSTVFCIITMYLAAYVAPGATEMLRGAGVNINNF